MKLRFWKSSKTKTAQAAQELQSDDEEQRYTPIEWPLVKRVIKNLLPYKKLYGAGLALGMIMLIIDMMSPLFMQHVIDHVTAYAGRKKPGDSPAQAVNWLVWLVVFWALALGIARIMERYVILIMTYAGEQVQFELRRRLSVRRTGA